MTEKERVKKQLERVRKSIELVELEGQESHAESGKARRQTRRAELQSLYERERQLINRLSLMSRAGFKFSRMEISN